MIGPEGKSEFCFPETLNVPQGKAKGNIDVERKQTSLFVAGLVTKCFVITPNSKRENKNAKKPFAWHRLAHKFAVVSRSTTWSLASRKFKLLFR